MSKKLALTLVALLVAAGASAGGLPARAATATAPDGWTRITPSADSRIVYVSASEGDDDNDGLSPQTPVQSLSWAQFLMRDGYPDHMLLKRGDVWEGEIASLASQAIMDAHNDPATNTYSVTNQLRFISGRSASEPAVISYYGESGDRPLIKTDGNFIDHNGRERSHVALIGLHIIGYKTDPGDPAYDPTVQNTPEIRYVGSGTDLLIEDCVLNYVGLTVQALGGTYHDVRLRRSVITDNYGLNTSTSNANRPSGMYVSGVDGILIEENVFDHNGWNEQIAGSGANQFNHNIYMQTDNVGNGVVVRGNIIARASSHGIHGRSGGLFEDNLFVENSVSLQLGYADTPLPAGTRATARNNVILGGKLMDPDDSDYPRTAAVWGLNLDNLGEGTVAVQRNIVADRKESGSNVGITFSDYAGLTYADNIQRRWGGGIGDQEDPSWPDPDRSVASYNATRGGAASLEAFLADARSRALGEWPEDLTAHAVDQYVRDGFGMSYEVPDLPPIYVPEPADPVDPTEPGLEVPPVSDDRWFGNLGDGTTGGSDSSADYVGGSRFTAPADLTLTHMRVQVGAGAGAIKLGVYASGQDGEPAAFLGTTEERTDIPEGWNEFELSTPVEVTAGASYWLTTWSDWHNYPLIGDTAPGSGAERYMSAPYAAEWPAVFAPDPYHPDLEYRIYAYGTPTATVADPLQPIADGVWLGSRSEGNTTDWSANYIGGSRFEAPADLILSHLRVKVGEGSGAIRLGVYAADEAGEPAGFLRGTEERTDIPAGWNEFELTSPLEVAAGTSYWIVVWSDEKNYPLYADWAAGSAAERYVYAEYGQDWPAILAADAYHPDLTLSLYAYGTLIEAGEPGAPGDPGTPGDPGASGSAPLPVPVDQLVDAARGSVHAPTSAQAGQAITVTVGAQHTGRTVWVWLYSQPLSLGARVVTADGTVTVSLPDDIAAGVHRIAVLDAQGSILGWTEITVTGAGSLAATGTDGDARRGALATAIGLIAAGAGVLILRRKTPADGMGGRTP